jgi:hypothetical protein
VNLTAGQLGNNPRIHWGLSEAVPLGVMEMNSPTTPTSVCQDSEESGVCRGQTNRVERDNVLQFTALPK